MSIVKSIAYDREHLETIRVTVEKVVRHRYFLSKLLS